MLKEDFFFTFFSSSSSFPSSSFCFPPSCVESLVWIFLLHIFMLFASSSLCPSPPYYSLCNPSISSLVFLFIPVPLPLFPISFPHSSPLSSHLSSLLSPQRHPNHCNLIYLLVSDQSTTSASSSLLLASFPPIVSDQ